MIEPIWCLIYMARSLLERIRDKDHCFELTTIRNTATLLLAHVHGMLDQSYLANNKLETRLTECSLVQEVVQPIIDVFSAAAES
jgi:hypothetical protein